MQYDRLIAISTAGSRRAIEWPASTLMWSQLVARLQTPVRSTETLDEYLAWPRSRQDDAKDVGGFVGGTFHGTRRKTAAVAARDVITLDLDNIPAGKTDDVLRRVEALGCAYVVYSTRKHMPGAPRLRILLPTDRPTTAEEYEPVARKLCELIGLEFADPTTFEPARLMYFPSVSADGVYVFYVGDKPFFSVDGVLGLYANWHDIASWPQVPGEADRRARSAKVQKDPTTKTGIVGAFCRQYDIPAVIDLYLADKYIPVSGFAGRYTFTGGSTAGGAVVYDDGQFLFSHHATDPASGQLCNAFDLVRLHYFGEKDDDAKQDTPVNRLPSYLAMCELALEDEGVSNAIKKERYEQAVEVFAEERGQTVEAIAQPDLNWMNQLTTSPKTGQILKTINNLYIILQHDPHLAGKVAFDEFSNRGLALGALPWDDRPQRRGWGNADDSALRQYIEKVYGIKGKDDVYDALLNASMANKFNDVLTYLEPLKWDGKKRIDTMLIRYFGAEDNKYTRAVTRKFMVAAVARIFRPGIKFDYMPIISGPQGCGKSTLLARLGRRWYTDSLTTFEGKEAAEIIQGNWIIEVGELNAMTRSETNAVKQFLTRTDDVFREAYGRRTERYPRRCVFAGTTNDAEYLRDTTGERRFWPVDLHPENATEDIFDALTDDEVDQLWAEAVAYCRVGEPLYLPRDIEAIAREQQAAHMISNPKEGLIREFLEKPLPHDWDEYTLGQRRMYWADDKAQEGASCVRTRVCAAEIWSECLGKDQAFFDQRFAREINGILARIEGWQKAKSTLRFGAGYGAQRAFYRETDTENEVFQSV